MASLIEDLINILKEECDIYNELTEVSMEKTPVIIRNDLQALLSVNGREQELIDQITGIEKRREQALIEIATVLSKDAKTVTVSEVIELISEQPVFQHPLIQIREELKTLIEKLKIINEHNRDLLEQSLEMAEYSINLIQGMNQAPETANYEKGSYSGETLGVNHSAFDTKQ